MNTTIKLTKTTFSTRVMAAAAALSISLTGALMPGLASAALAAPAVNPASMDVCGSARPVGLWFPPQVEMQFKMQCSGGGVLASPAQLKLQAMCNADHAQRGWFPPQVEMQFAAWCK